MEDKTQKIVLDVPYYSQWLDVKDKKWQSRVCGIVCLKMVMDFFANKDGRKNPSADDLIKENEFINGFGSFGSDHESLIMLARNHGFHAYRQEFKSLHNDYANNKIKTSSHENRLTDEGVDKKVRKLENGFPVIVSAIKNFSEKDKFHLVVLTGFKKENGKLKGFYYHDPDSSDSEEGMHKFVDIDTFKKHWRKMAIYVSI